MSERIRDGNRWIYPPLEERLWSRVEKTRTCWLWTGYCIPTGYGKMRANDGRLLYVHRIAYELLIGPIPDGMTLDHVAERGCRHRNCVNPDHLEPVTHAENVLRGRSPSALWAARTHCNYGHEFTPENTYMNRGARVCRTCTRERSRRAYWARKAAS